MRALPALGALVLALVTASRDAVPAPPIPPAAATLVADDATQPSAAVDAEGTVYVAFLHAGNVSVRVSKDRGATFGELSVAIDAKGRARGGAQCGPRLGVDAKGRLVVTSPLTFDDAEAAKKYPAPEVYLATSDDGGASSTPPVRVLDDVRR